MRKPVFGISTRSDTNRAVQSQKMARGLKFQILIEEGLHYQCSENKGADQLHSYREADLRLFSHMQKASFLTMRLILLELGRHISCHETNLHLRYGENNDKDLQGYSTGRTLLLFFPAYITVSCIFIQLFKPLAIFCGCTTPRL